MQSHAICRDPHVRMRKKITPRMKPWFYNTIQSGGGGIKSKVEESSPNGSGGIKYKVEVEWTDLKANFEMIKLFKSLYRLHISRDLWRHKIIILTNQRIARHSNFMRMRTKPLHSTPPPLQKSGGKMECACTRRSRHVIPPPPPPLPKKWSLHYKKVEGKWHAHAQEEHATYRTVTILSHVI